MSITIVRFNSIPVCQLAPNFVSPMLLVGTDSSGSAGGRCAFFSPTSPRCAAAIFSRDFADAIRFSPAFGAVAACLKMAASSPPNF